MINYIIFYSNTSDQPPLKLVLKVGSSSTNDSNFLTSSVSEQQISEDQINHSSDYGEGNRDDQLQAGGSHLGSSSSAKKLKKKKKSKKHHKHRSHHSHHSHHHRHHHRRSSCSHHSKSSTSSHHVAANNDVTASVPSKIYEQSQIPHTQQQTPQQTLPSKSPTHQRMPSSKQGNKAQFQQFLHHLLKVAQRRDTQSFFAWPVTENIAPGYSKFISHPMDFSTMKKKIDQGCYEVLDQFKYDIKLICDNAMRFNGADTVYFKAARKLWHYAKCKIFNRSSIQEISKSFPELSRSQLSLDAHEETQISCDPSNFKASENGHFQPIDQDRLLRGDVSDEIRDIDVDLDELSGQKLLESVEKSAKWAADRLTLKKPQGSHLSFFRQKDDGTTTLGIIGCPSDEKVVKIENLVGKLSEGLPCLPSYQEPESNRIKLIDSVPTTQFSSYLPSLDSSNATLNQEETQLLTSTYGEDELGIHYSQSLLSFANESDYVMNMVGSLLEVLTQGKHSNALSKLKEMQKEKKEKAKDIAKAEKNDPGKEGESEKAESNETVNSKNNKGDNLFKTQATSTFNSEDVEMQSVTENSSLQTQLDSQATLVSELEQLNNRRLASSTAPIPPSDDEMNLANILCEKLTKFISNNATPGDISDPRAIRKALGVQIKSE